MGLCARNHFIKFSQKSSEDRTYSLSWPPIRQSTSVTGKLGPGWCDIRHFPSLNESFSPILAQPQPGNDRPLGNMLPFSVEPSVFPLGGLAYKTHWIAEAWFSLIITCHYPFSGLQPRIAQGITLGEGLKHGTNRKCRRIAG